MEKEIQVGDFVIAQGRRPFIVAEAGVNHENDMETAKQMIREAKASGADAIKFQTYKAEKIAARESPAYWDTGKTQREFFQRFDQFGEDEFRELAHHAKDHNILFMSTPFDEEAVEFLNELMPLFKISSSDITNLPFIKKISQCRKPIFLSVGASTIDEIRQAVDTILAEEKNPIVLLHCVLSYPTPYSAANLRSIPYLQQTFPTHLIGYSDHTLPDPDLTVLLTAAILGAVVLEKHFTLDKTLPNNDHYHAMDPTDLAKFNEKLDFVLPLMGTYDKPVLEVEKLARQFARRSLVTAHAIKRGTPITRDLLTAKRPATGISPSELDKVVGKKAKRDLEEDHILTWDDIH